MMKILKFYSSQFLLLAVVLGTPFVWAQEKAKPLAPDAGITLTPSAKEGLPTKAKNLTDEEIEPRKTSGYVAKHEGIQSLFNALSSEAKKPFILSKLAQKKTITGDFDISHPYKFLEKLSNQIGLAWYDDGQAIYVYDNSELKNSVVILRHASLAKLNEFLQRTGLFTKRYPIRGEQKTGAFYVAGPPVYVELVVNAAAYLDGLYQNVDLNKQKISVIKLQHTIVGDRTYTVRDQEIKVAGIGKVIEAVLANEGKELVAITDEEKVTPLIPSPGKVPLPLPVSSSNPSPQKEIVHERTKIKVIPYPETNSLLVKGTQEQVELIESLVAQLDVPKRHIELSLWIIDITKTALDQLGIDWQGALNVGTRGRVAFNVDPTSTSTLNANRFLAQISALNRDGVAQVITRPIILTQDNVPAVFDRNDTFYTKLQAERVANLEKVTYGTLIKVLPRYSTAGEEVEMVLDIEDGRQTPRGQGTLSNVDGLPVVTRTTISTVARVPKDKSLLVGGFTLDDYANTNNKIPFLGDLPLVGSLFRTDSESTQKVVRVYLIQPKLLDLGSIWNAQGFSSPSMLSPEEPLRETLEELKGYSGVQNGQQH